MWQKSWTILLALQLQWFIDDEQNSIVCKHCLCRSPVPDPWETGIIGSKLLERNLLYKERIWNESICAYVYLCVCVSMWNGLRFVAQWENGFIDSMQVDMPYSSNELQKTRQAIEANTGKTLEHTCSNNKKMATELAESMRPH